jgi:arylsulfatase A-like enzyme
MCAGRDAKRRPLHRNTTEMTQGEFADLRVKLQRRARFAGVVTAMDQAIENITAALEHKGMLHNTLVVFTTDNGAGALSASVCLVVVHVCAPLVCLRCARITVTCACGRTKRELREGGERAVEHFLVLLLSCRA